MNIWLAVFLGGGLGSMARFGISRLLLNVSRDAFPWATLFSNVIASGLLAWFMFRMQHELQDRDAMKAFLAVGFCGGLSTFSTFSYENFLLLREGLPLFAIINMAVSVLLCVFVFILIARTV